MIFSIFQFLLIFTIFVLIVNYIYASGGYEGPISDHFNGVRFRNYFEEYVRKGAQPDRQFNGFNFMFRKAFDNVRWKKRGLVAGEAKPAERVLGKEIVVTYINHSTVLLQTEGINIITDPIWSYRASPVEWFGPARYSPPGMKLENLPHIDMILLSHNHYDHMDLKALKWITHRDTPTLYTTLGNSQYLEDKGIYNAVDMDWGDSQKFSDEITVDCVPAQHFAARALTDRNKTLWGGFVICTTHGNIYFAGDTGYGPFISHIQKAYPEGFRFALIPIGAFEPRAFMHMAHQGPAEAVMMYRDLKVQHALSIHHSTFDLGLDDQDEPKDRLTKILAESENSDIDFFSLNNGESHTIS